MSCSKKINNAVTLIQLEDIYLPYKPKRKTKAQVARENGLEPLTMLILEQKDFDVESKAAEFVNEVILTPEQALQGARDIMAENINEDSVVREK